MAFSLKKWIGSMLFSAFMNEYNENMEAIEDKFGEVEADISLFAAPQDITWDSTDRVWHDKPSGFYLTTSSGPSLGYPSDYMFVLHISSGPLVWNFAFSGISVWVRRFNKSQSMVWRTP